MSAFNQPLAGIKVVELGQNVAGPYASAILSALGAEVTKIERPEGGDDARGWAPPAWNGTSTTFEVMNLAKRSVALDLAKQDSIEWLRRLVRDCDVLIHNLRPGVMERLGLGPEQLCGDNPLLIYCSLSAFGHKGPLRSKPGYEPILQAFSGIFSVNGSEDGPGVRVGMQVLDLGTGLWGALGCVAALFQRAATGRGCVVEASLFETALGWLQIPLAGFQASGVHPVKHSSGNPNVVVFQSFITSDGSVLIAAANDRLFAKLAHALELPHLASDARFATNASRVEHKQEVVGAVQSVLQQRPTAHWIDLLEAAGVPCAPINDLRQMLDQPQSTEIGILQTIPDCGLKVVGLPVSFGGERPPIRGRAPRLGEHTDQLRNR